MASEPSDQLVCEWCEDRIVFDREGYIKSQCNIETCGQIVLHVECVPVPPAISTYSNTCMQIGKIILLVL